MTSVPAPAFRDVYDPRLDTFKRFLAALCDFEKQPGLGSAAYVRAAFRLHTDLAFTGHAEKAELREDLEEIIGSRLERIAHHV